MNSRNELKDICPTSFEETWDKYPKLRHLLQSTVLFDFQHTEWKPYTTVTHNKPIPVFLCSDANVYIEDKKDISLISHVVICKGEVKQIDHFTQTHECANEFKGGLDLKIGAFVASSFKKMSCVISVISSSNVIEGIMLHPDFDYIDKTNNTELVKAIKKLYNRREWS